jgi:hypothetical protein
MIESLFKVFDGKIDFGEGLLTNWQFNFGGLHSLECQQHNCHEQNETMPHFRKFYNKRL